MEVVVMAKEKSEKSKLEKGNQVGQAARLKQIKKSAMISCNDGFRPVSFLLETMDEDAD